VGKILHINAGESLSLQYHEVKDETIFLFTGAMRFWVGPSVDALEEVHLEAGEAFRIRPRTVHRMQAVTDCDVFEASTPHLDDVVRLEDRYGRTTEG
jgi:mannose-6-phosphate isomerase-like protein (cupin superfamily)